MRNSVCFKFAFRALVASLVLLAPVALLTADDALQWHELPSLPDAEGFAGSYAGTSNGRLLVAGGANFPDQRPWEGGEKVWYDNVFALELPTPRRLDVPSSAGLWKRVGQLPRPLGYGVSVTTAAGLMCIGGSDSSRHYADCLLLQWDGDELRTRAVPALPRPCANFCGHLLGHTIYVAGGTDSPTATAALHTFWSLDLNNQAAGWRKLTPWPGPARMLSVAAVQGNAFFICGGAQLSAGPDGEPRRTYLQDAYRYQPSSGWQRIADLPRCVVAAPTPAPTMGQSTFLVIGGDAGEHVGFEPPAAHPGFSQSVLAYYTLSDTWKTLADAPLGLVTTNCVPWNGRWVIPSGEIRPGVRSPAVWSLKKVSDTFLGE